MAEAIKIDPKKIKRSKPEGDKPETPTGPPSVSAGPIEKVIELAFNPTREKIREMTIIDRLQARLLPQLDLISLQWQYTIEIALYRQDSSEYEKLYNKKQPTPPALLEEYMYRVAQWQKSREGKNLDRAIDLALAETEARAGEEDFGKDADKYYQE